MLCLYMVAKSSPRSSIGCAWKADIFVILLFFHDYQEFIKAGNFTEWLLTLGRGRSTVSHDLTVIA